GLALGALALIGGCSSRTVVVHEHHYETTPEPEPEPEPQPETVVVEIEFSYFHDSLSPHGTWVYLEGYGDCWYPSDVDDDWRPYHHGHWVWIDECGWYWVSYYKWGWACEHYGRWIYVHGR